MELSELIAIMAASIYAARTQPNLAPVGTYRDLSPDPRQVEIAIFQARYIWREILRIQREERGGV